MIVCGSLPTLEQRRNTEETPKTGKAEFLETTPAMESLASYFAFPRVPVI